MSKKSNPPARKLFPIERLPGVYREMALAMVGKYQCGVNLPSMAVLGALSSAMGNRFLAANSVGLKDSQANLFQIAVAKSGDGKSQVMSCAFRPIEDYEQELIKEWRDKVEPRAKARKELINIQISELKSASKAKVKKAEADREAEAACAAGDPSEGVRPEGFQASDFLAADKDDDQILANDETVIKSLEKLYRLLASVERELIQPRMIVDDCTPEKMASLLANFPCLISASAEARKAVDVLLGRYNSKGNDQPSDDVFVKAFTGDSIRVDRQGAGSINIPNPCLSVLWMVQPGKVDKLLTTEALKDSGFLQRCLIGYSEGVSGNFLDAVPIPAEVSRSYSEALRAILAYDVSVNGQGIVKVSHAAGLRVNEVREERRQFWAEKGNTYQSFECRYAEQVVRIALNLHMGKFPGGWAKREIDVETVEDAIEILGFYTQNHDGIFASFEHNEAVSHSVEVAKLLKHFGGAFTLREARRSPLKALEPGLEDYLEAEVAERRLHKFRAGRTDKYTDQKHRAKLPEDPPDKTKRRAEPPAEPF
jgi:hypothetical protein